MFHSYSDRIKTLCRKYKENETAVFWYWYNDFKLNIPVIVNALKLQELCLISLNYFQYRLIDLTYLVSSIVNTNDLYFEKQTFFNVLSFISSSFGLYLFLLGSEQLSTNIPLNRAALILFLNVWAVSVAFNDKYVTSALYRLINSVLVNALRLNKMKNGKNVWFSTQSV